MSLPNDRLSAVPIYAPFQPPRDRLKSALVDYHLGGNAINDPSAGLRVKNWTGRYVGGQVRLSAIGVLPVAVLTVANVANFSFCFDDQMRPAVAYELTGGGSRLYWYNPDASDYETLELAGARSPRVTLDDSRAGNIALDRDDVLLTYLRGTVLYYRQQRDGFAIERELATGRGSQIIGRFGANLRNAVQWEMVTALVPDPAFPPDSILEVLDTPPFMGGDPPGLGVWIAAASAASSWPGAAVEMSRDGGSTWSLVASITAASVIGELSDALPDYGGANPDTSNTVEVALETFGAAFQSTTDDQLPMDNLILVGTEQLRFRDASGPSTAQELDHLLRGLNTTATDAHSAGARVVELDPYRLTFLPLLPEDVGEELLFRATTLGADAPSDTVTLTFQGLSEPVT